MLIPKPNPGTYPTYYDSYFPKLEQEDLISALTETSSKAMTILESFNEENSNYAYQDGKWSAKELMQHVIDTERIFQYRALAISRGENAKLPGFDENNYAANSLANNRSWIDIIQEYLTVRMSSICLTKSMVKESFSLQGNANGVHVSVSAIMWMIAAHDAHHLGVLNARYNR